MKNQITIIVNNIKSCNCSKYGNPKYEITYNNGAGEPITAKTATDASCAYLFGYHSIGRAYDIITHTTQSGNIIIDYAKEI